MHKGTFLSRNGRLIFENPPRRLWHCDRCGWWREWETLTCCGCGARRDSAVISVHESVLRSIAAEPAPARLATAR